MLIFFWLGFFVPMIDVAGSVSLVNLLTGSDALAERVVGSDALVVDADGSDSSRDAP